MPFQIIRNDITKVKADAIVNTANPKPIIGSGTDSAIYMAAGKEQLLAERRKIGEIAPGEVASTPAFGLDAKYILHVVGPVWTDGNHGEREILHSCYANALGKALELSCESIAFPLIATGAYGFPKDEALQIALAEINRFLLVHDMKIILVVFDRKAMELSERLVGDIEEYIDEHAAGLIRDREYAHDRIRERERREIRERRYQDSVRYLSNTATQMSLDEKRGSFGKLSFASPAEASLDDVLGNAGDSFQQRLFQLIDASGMDDVTVYKKANIDRKVFSRIRCKVDYKPKKKTAVAFAIALQLDMPTMLDLLSRAEIAFSPSNKFDIIISYFVTHKIYDIYEINTTLFKYGQPILGE